MKDKANKQFRITLWLLAGVVVSIIIHNVIKTFNFYEPVSFSLIFIFTIAVFISALYTLILNSRAKKR